MPTWTCSGPTGCHLCHHLAEDVEDPADDAEDPGDGPEALEEALMTHSVVIHAMMMSWVPGRRSGKPTCDVLMYLDHRGPRAWLRWLKNPMMPLS